MKRARDFAQVHGTGEITDEAVTETLRMLEIDDAGLEEMDRELLRIIIGKFGGGPVGLGALSAALSEEPGTIEDVYEPYLMSLGFLNRTSMGRVVTRDAYKYLGFEVPKPLL